MTAANPAVSLGSTYRAASPPTSGRPPRRDATSAVPHAMASAAARPKGSSKTEGTHATDARR